MGCIRRRIVKPLRSGFTLVELLVVISTIALLLSILIPSLAKARSMTHRIKCASNLKQIGLAVRFYVEANNDTYPCADDPLPRGYWLWMGRGWRSFVEPYLGGNIDANNPSVLFCPEDRTNPAKYESTSYAYSMSFYHSPQQIDDMSSIGEQYGTSSVDSIPQKCFNVVRPPGKIVIGEWDSHHFRIDGRDPGWWGWQGRRNFLFADGQVLFLKTEQIRKANDGNPNPNLTVHGIKGRDWPENGIYQP